MGRNRAAIGLLSKPIPSSAADPSAKYISDKEFEDLELQNRLLLIDAIVAALVKEDKVPQF